MMWSRRDLVLAFLIFGFSLLNIADSADVTCNSGNGTIEHSDLAEIKATKNVTCPDYCVAAVYSPKNGKKELQWFQGCREGFNQISHYDVKDKGAGECQWGSRQAYNFFSCSENDCRDYLFGCMLELRDDKSKGPLKGRLGPNQLGALFPYIHIPSHGVTPELESDDHTHFPGLVSSTEVQKVPVTSAATTDFFKLAPGLAIFSIMMVLF